LQSYHQQLQTHALADLTNRAKSGIFTYLCVWLILVFTYEINVSDPIFFYLNTCMIVLMFASRLGHYFALSKSKSPNISLYNQWLILTILAAAVHWGIMSAWVIHDANLANLRTIILIITPAFALGGACTLSISPEIRTLYPVFMCLPFIGTLIYQGDTESLMFALLMTICLIYIFSSSKATHNDYWSAITNHLVAEERAELMEELSTTDPLTELRNRMFFDKEFSNEWKRCSRLGCPLSIIMIDLDYFKNLNDNYGHMFGDECLKQAANAIRNEVARPADCVARYGGEEFIILLPNTNPEGTKRIAIRMLKAVENLILKADGQNVTLTCSIGGSTTTPDFRKDRSSLIKQADTALYYAKEHGRNRYYSESV